MNRNFITAILLISYLSSSYPSYLSTNLHRFAKNGHVYQCERLINSGANLNEINYKGDVPLHIAAWWGEEGVCTLLIEKGANMNAKNINQATPLHLAIEQNEKAICFILIKKKANLDLKNSQGDTPLHLAVLEEIKEVCSLLMEYHAEVNVKNNNQNTPLHYAAMNGNEAICRLLLNYAPHILTNKKGETALDLAKSNEIKKMITLYEETKIAGYLGFIKERESIPQVIISLVFYFSTGKNDTCSIATCRA